MRRTPRQHADSVVVIVALAVVAVLLGAALPRGANGACQTSCTASSSYQLNTVACDVINFDNVFKIVVTSPPAAVTIHPNDAERESRSRENYLLYVSTPDMDQSGCPEFVMSDTYNSSVQTRATPHGGSFVVLNDAGTYFIEVRRRSMLATAMQAPTWYFAVHEGATTVNDPCATQAGTPIAMSANSYCDAATGAYRCFAAFKGDACAEPAMDSGGSSLITTLIAVPIAIVVLIVLLIVGGFLYMQRSGRGGGSSSPQMIVVTDGGGGGGSQAGYAPQPFPGAGASGYPSAAGGGYAQQPGASAGYPPAAGGSEVSGVSGGTSVVADGPPD